MNKVSEIEFHITGNEIDDFILRAAELVKEGYRLYSIDRDKMYYGLDVHPEPNIHVKFTRWHA